MPIGSLSAISPIVADFCRTFSLRGHHNGPRVLDLGIGFGIYGAAIRNWYDHGVSPYRAYLTGVEGWSAYRNPCWTFYDELAICPIEQWVLSALDRKFDCVILSDVLEHFNPVDGERIVRQLQSMLLPGGRMYVTTPGVWFAQGEAHGNPLEVHRSFWPLWQLGDLGFCAMGEDGRRFDGQTIDRVGWIDPVGAQVIVAVYERPLA